MSLLHLCAIGDEVLDGRTLNTNIRDLARFFTENGYDVIKHTTLADSFEAFEDFYLDKNERASIIITCGGLGPTEDDRTRQALSKVFSWDFQIHKKWLEHLENNWRKVDTALTSQALLPEGAHLIENKHGTACGFIKQKQDKSYIFLPGVPRECLGMLPDVLSYLKRHITSDKKKLYYHNFQVFGVYERVLNDHLKKIQQDHQLSFHWGLYPSYCEVKVHLRSECEKDLKTVIEILTDHYQKRFYQKTLCEDLIEHLSSCSFDLLLKKSRPAYYLNYFICQTQEQQDHHSDKLLLPQVRFIDSDLNCENYQERKSNQPQIFIELSDQKAHSTYQWTLNIKVIDASDQIVDNKNLITHREIVTDCLEYADKKIASWTLGEVLYFLRVNFSNEKRKNA